MDCLVQEYGVRHLIVVFSACGRVGAVYIFFCEGSFLFFVLQVYVLQEAGPNNWRRSDMLKDWHRYGGVMILGYDMYRNLSQCTRIRSKHQKKIFKESLVDPGILAWVLLTT